MATKLLILYAYTHRYACMHTYCQGVYIHTHIRIHTYTHTDTYIGHGEHGNKVADFAARHAAPRMRRLIGSSTFAVSVVVIIYIYIYMYVL
jgi:predicted alpha-1,6-mannanase (GH76 family)